MNLLVQNMEFDILSNGIKKILNCIMCDGVLSPMNTTKYVYPFQIYGLVAYALRKTMSHRIGEAQFGA
jgi:hypothetical protein